MKRNFFFLFLTCLLFPAIAQIPAGYYDGTDGLSGEALRAKLYDIINGHTTVSYDGLWNAFKTSDKKANGKVWDMYSDVPGGTPSYEFTFTTDQCGSYSGEGDCYNREHSFPKSWFNDATPMYSDMFHLVPTDGYVNGRRSNYAFGEVNSPTWTSTNGSKLGPNVYPGYSGTVFEPIDSFKGDFARSYFYMATRYYNVMNSWGPMSSGNNLATWAVNMLKDWASLDPVSTKEINRNNIVYGYQHNRNPYIDHPEFINCVWGSNCSSSPTITNIAHTPSIPSPSNTVAVNATITDDGTISTAKVKWCTDGTSFNNNINMTLVSGSNYTSSTAIPAQANGITVSYKIEATDNLSNVTLSPASSYTVYAPTYASVTTAAVSNISLTAASCGGNVTSQGGAAVTARGVCWSTSTNPVASGNHTTDGSGTGIFTSSITGLSAGTTYYVRAYATNSYGTNYGSNVSFTTLKAAPTVQASQITFPSIGNTSVGLSWTNGNGDGRIVLINTTNSFTNPVNGNDPMDNAIYSGSGEQVVYNGVANNVTVSGLAPGTQYWFRVYEFNNSGSDIKFFTNMATNNPKEVTTITGPCMTESFENIPASASTYADRTWTGDNGGTWTATTARTDQTINTKAICFKGILTSPSLPSGIGTLTFNHKTPFTDAGAYVTVWVNGVQYGSNISVGTTVTPATVNINNPGASVLEIKSNNTWRIAIDDIETTCYTTNVTSNEAKQIVSCFPNPAQNNLSVFFKKDIKDATLIISNIQGKHMLKQSIGNANENSQVELKLNNFAAGMYILQINSIEGIYTQRLIIK